MTEDGFGDVEQAVALLDSLTTGVDQLIAGAFWRINGDDLLDVGRRLELLGRKVFAAQVRLAGELDAQGAARSRGCSSIRALLTESLGISMAEAGLRVRAAQLTLPQDLPSGGERPPLFPHLGAAVDAGRIGAEHVRTTTATLRRLPEAVRAEAEPVLVEHAETFDATAFDRIARHLEIVLNPDGALADRDAAARAELTIGSRSAGTGLTRITGYLDDLGAETVRTAIRALAAPAPAADGVPDPRTPANRNAQALVDICGWFLAHGDAPDTGGERPQVTVTLDFDALSGLVGGATLGSGQPVSASQARRLLCDAQILPAVLGGASEVLDVGRAQRTATAAMRRALALRDKGCSWPGCDRPPAWCDAHHALWWQRDLGPTSVDNLTLLCPFHHTEIHRGQWTLLFEAGRPVFIPPPWIDPNRAPRRNTLHDLGRSRRWGGSSPPQEPG